MKYDVCLSFAGEDRPYVELVYVALDKAGVAVFYDKAQQVELWGNDLTVFLADVYRRDSRFCIVFVSQHYVRKAWTNHERQHAFARQLDSEYSYLLPAKLDSTELPGLSPTIACVDCTQLRPEQFAQLAAQKIMSTTQLPTDEIFLRLAKGEFLTVVKRLADILRAQDRTLTPRDKNFVLYNLACAQSRAAQYSATNESARNRFLNDALASLRRWFDHVDKNTLRSVPDAVAYVQADDDLLFLRQQRATRLSRLIGNVCNPNPTGSSGGGCVTLDSSLSTPLGFVHAAELHRGQEIWSVDPSPTLWSHRRTRALVAQTTRRAQQPIVCINERLNCTPEQRLFSVSAGWIRAADIRPGTCLYAEHRSEVAVTSIRGLPFPATVLALQTDHNTHNFFAEGFLCHNIKW